MHLAKSEELRSLKASEFEKWGGGSSLAALQKFTPMDRQTDRNRQTDILIAMLCTPQRCGLFLLVLLSRDLFICVSVTPECHAKTTDLYKNYVLDR